MQDNDLLKFLRSQKVISIATVDEKSKPWICNVYFGIDKDLNFYFISSPKTVHGKHIKNNNNVAISTVWFNEKDTSDRKAIQAIGTASLIRNPKQIASLIKAITEKFPEWGKSLKVEDIMGKRAYIIKPSYIKFWNDELFGEEKTKEYTF